MTNPYRGQEPYEYAWQQGHTWGTQNPGTDQPAPPDFSGWGLDDATTSNVGQVWQEGALAGRESTATPTTASAATGSPAPAATDRPTTTTTTTVTNPDGSTDTLDGGVTDQTADGSLPGGVATPPPAVDWSRARVHTAKFWLNAFISPDHVDGPPGYGLVYNYEYFSGDGRGYSSDIHASSRLHSEAEITGVNTGQPQISFQWHDCGESHALDSSLSIIDSKKAAARGTFGEPTWDGSWVTVTYSGAANMPLITGSPDIDANGTFYVDPFSGQVEFHGMIDSFPWFEAYATVNNGAPVMLINEDPTGSGPQDLFGDANRGVSGSARALAAE